MVLPCSPSFTGSRASDRPGAVHIATISTFTTLEPGDVILTGTPATTNRPTPLEHGDVVTITIDGIGHISNRFIRHPHTQPATTQVAPAYQQL
ncbi:fumarylacetoacetate hydrolase family protein [Gordonia McavH-238-E]|uniref:fumarylacetoacetate hydrolase family protein n=1 Tax=Gordonia sp. McavH-238-E TaxID=2917736 RepID=UPI001EF5AB01|nr:fumarylacetoacetate hydrolase family protein [Gordonia sp. McavH-238-E]MCG7635681.1 fumarylacetoacetate hydrolase family protein [Gordonia sp. McavH-238-E]